MPKLMNQAIISVGDVSINIPDLKMKAEPLFYKYTTFTVDSNYNNLISAGNSANASGLYNPLAFTASGSGFYDPKEMYDARERYNTATSTLEEVNPNATYKFTAPEEGLYRIKITLGNDVASTSGGTPTSITSALVFDNTNNHSKGGLYRPDGTKHISWTENEWSADHPHRDFQVNMAAGQVFWLSGWSIGATDAFMQVEIQIDLIKVVQETA